MKHVDSEGIGGFDGYHEIRCEKRRFVTVWTRPETSFETSYDPNTICCNFLFPYLFGSQYKIESPICTLYKHPGPRPIRVRGICIYIIDNIPLISHQNQGFESKRSSPWESARKTGRIGTVESNFRRCLDVYYFHLCYFWCFLSFGP